MASMDTRTEHRQRASLSPKLQHAVRLLQLSSFEFAQCVHEALETNPFLEGLDDDEPADNDFADSETGNDRELWLADGDGSGRPAHHDGLSALDRMAVETSLAQHLSHQLSLQPLSKRERLLAQVIVGSLDDDGYLRASLDELRDVAGLRPRATLIELERALDLVQALEPLGVGARGVGECLYLQLPAIECPHMRALAATIIEHHLPQLAAQDLATLSRWLSRPVAEVAAVCERIRHFDPHPGWRHGSSRIDYVVPDVIARRQRGGWAVDLNPAVVPRVRLNQTYAEMLRRAGSTHNRELASHLQDARWTVRTVENRFCTILDVARTIVRRQRQFLEYGPMAMKPLSLREVADELGMHESTVSRVTSNKYLATPSGVFELKHFFARAMPTASGNACTGTAIRGLVDELIGAEDSSAPLSDAEIARRLARQGLTVARRTVTKYRQDLRIASVDQRRRRAAITLHA